MTIYMPEKCLRDLQDCEPLAQIHSENAESFVCCGLNDGTRRKEKQDIFRHCWVSPDTDDMNDMDSRDIADTISVLAQTISVHENMKANKQEFSESDD